MPDDTRPLTVTSVGHYILTRRLFICTRRKQGRRDFQLLYIRRGCARFMYDQEEYLVPSGNAVIYFPGDEQWYSYALKDSPEVCWAHFTGSQAAEVLSELGLSGGVTAIAEDEDYGALFNHLIRELQMKKPYYRRAADAAFEEMLCKIARSAGEKTEGGGVICHRVVEEAVRMMQTGFNRPFEVAEYAAGQNISACWFTRLFTRQIGVSPLRYLTELRIGKARELLSSSVSVSEISAILGYQDPLYFSRVFKKYTGVSPSCYRSGHTTST